jgi:hypothetical protein
VRLFLGVGALALAALVCGCGKKGPPSGGPPDLVPPRLVSSQPDSGAAHVAADAALSLTFSEGMEPRSTGDAIALAPPIEIRRVRWSGRTVTVVLAESLKAHHAYTLLVGVGAHDRHGNALDRGAAVVFTTGDSFPPGRIEGKIEAKGFNAGSAYLWCYVTPGRQPDSTGRDFDALGIVDQDGRFRIPGLAVPARYRLWTFADLNGNRSFEPATDVLAPIDTVLDLTEASPRAVDLLFRVVNPRAPARIRGTVVDSLREREGTVVVVAVADTDTTRRVSTGVIPGGAFDLQLEAGGWTLRAFKDLDRNRQWNPANEPSSPPQRLRLEPADVREDVILELQPVAKSP